jgi:hypothetical protein
MARYEIKQRVWVRCIECECTASLQGVLARVERDVIHPIDVSPRCTQHQCTCHYPVPTDTNLTLYFPED